ncbi:MAG TPA: hypothetical protein VHZ78_15900 [Rhizomicrobium sp.]|nr:hypothetical protein [Rhizomicrobium sp.]
MGVAARTLRGHGRLVGGDANDGSLAQLGAALYDPAQSYTRT